MSEVSQSTATDIRFSLENSAALKTLKSVRRMFDASSSYLFCVVLPLVDEGRSLVQFVKRVTESSGVITLKTFM